jgi:hypothetical protein
MTLDQLVKLPYQAMKTWAEARKGRATVARDPLDVLILLTQGPAGFLVIFLWDGDSASEIGADETDVDQSGAVEVHPPATNRIEVIIGRNLGLDVRKDWALIAERDGRAPLLKLVNEARAKMLALVYPDDATSLRRFVYRGCDSVSLPDGFPLAAYKLRFELVATVDVEDEEEVLTT